MHNLVRNYRLAPITAFTAIAYFDKFCDQAYVPAESEELAALACVLIAAKCEEREEDIPRFRKLLRCPRQAYTKDELVAMEMIVLMASDWNMTTVVPACYIEYYCHHSITAADTVCSLPVIDTAGLEETLRDYAAFFLESSSRVSAMTRRFAPSVLAAGAVAATRICLSIEPRWSDGIAMASGLDEADVVPCVVEMLALYEQTCAVQRQESPAAVQQAAAMVATAPTAVKGAGSDLGTATYSSPTSISATATGASGMLASNSAFAPVKAPIAPVPFNLSGALPTEMN